uniref:Uncharacterized protein n=1 Tax=Leersia perrieri TaxID=77586 RepID=A0A0D9W696_9ORYZ
MAPAAAADAVKLSISGAALAALLGCCGSAEGDCDGLLFGRAACPPAPPPSFYDDDNQARASSGPSLTIAVSGHASAARPSSLADALGRYRSSSSSAASAVGFFSSRRRTPLRPSMREAALARSLSKALAVSHPLVFILVSPSVSPALSVHSYDYRAYLLVDSSRRLVPASLHVVNAGAGSREEYLAFAPESPLPSMPQQPVKESYSIGEQKALDRVVEGFGMERMGAMLTSAAGVTSEMEGMYGGMLTKLEGLARQVEESNERVLDQVIVGS